MPCRKSNPPREARVERYRFRPIQSLFFRDASGSPKRSISFTLRTSLYVSGYMDSPRVEQFPKHKPSNPPREARVERYRFRPIRGLYFRDASESPKRSISFTLRPSLYVSDYMDSSRAEQFPKHKPSNPPREARVERYRFRPIQSLFFRDASGSPKRSISFTLRPHFTFRVTCRKITREAEGTWHFPRPSCLRACHPTLGLTAYRATLDNEVPRRFASVRERCGQWSQ